MRDKTPKYFEIENLKKRHTLHSFFAYRKRTELTRLFYLIVENNFLYGQKGLFNAVLVPKKELFQLKRSLRERQNTKVL